jgi:hypothetical protein
MIKLLRKGAIEKPWFYRTAMGLIAAAFIISMGWYGFRQPKQMYVAKIGDAEISRVEYRRAYQNAYQFYKQMLKDQFDEKDLGKIVINGMVNRKLWLKAAGDLNVMANPVEVVDTLRQDRSFFRKGRFDPEQYRFVLANSRPPLTPEQYETNVRNDLSVDKVKRLLTDGIILTQGEIANAKATVKDDKLTPEKRAAAEERAVQTALGMKKQRALSAYIDVMKSATSIDINDVLL